MTREEAITILQNEQSHCGKKLIFTEEEKYEAYNMALKALEQERTTKNDLGVDCVRRKAVLDTLERMDKALDEDRTVDSYKELLKECYKVLPSVTPQEPFINKPCVSEKVCEHDKKVIFDKIRAKIDNAIEFERKWLYDAGHISKDIDIALNAIKSVMTESEVEDGNDK